MPPFPFQTRQGTCGPSTSPRHIHPNPQAGLFLCRAQSLKAWVKPSTCYRGLCAGPLPHTSRTGHAGAGCPGPRLPWQRQLTQGTRVASAGTALPHGLCDKEHFTLLVFCPATSGMRELLQPQLHPALQPPSRGWTLPELLLPIKVTQIPTGIFLLPVHPGDRVVAVCILVIAILNGVGWAGAVCGGSRGQLGLLHLVFPQGCSKQRACKLGRAMNTLPGQLSISTCTAPTSPHHTELEQTMACNNKDGKGAGQE